MEYVKKYLELAEKKSQEKLQEESKKSRKEKNSIGVRYWFDRWQSYQDLKSKIVHKDEGKLPLKLLEFEDFLKIIETSINSLNKDKDFHERNGRLDSYHDIRYMILGKDEERESLRLDKEANIRKS